MSIASLLAHEIMTDDEREDDERVIAAYEDADRASRAVVDDIFISLCGYSLETLIRKAT